MRLISTTNAHFCCSSRMQNDSIHSEQSQLVRQRLKDEWLSRFTTRVLLLCCILPLFSTTVFSQDPTASQYQRTLAKAVRKIASETLNSVVTIEVIGVMQADGEVRQDAPTSGVVVDADGHILASSWVTKSNSASIIVIAPDGQRYPASIVARDEHRDLVLLKVAATDASWTPVTFADSEPTEDRIGETLIAVARYGESNTPMVSTGILSATGRLDGTSLQTDARISPAFYGGPLLDLKGRFRGVVIPAVGEGGAEDPTAWYDSGIAFAVPSSIISTKLDRLKNGETIQPGVLGFVIAGSDPYADGTRLSVVRKRSPADKAGLRVGDVLKSIGGKPVRRRQEIKLALGPFDAGEEITIEYEREGEVQTTQATMIASIPPLQPQFIGLLATEKAAADEIPEASTADSDSEPSSVSSIEVVVTGTLKGSPADGTFQANDTLLEMDGSAISDLSTLRQRVWASEPDQPINFQLLREGETKTVDIKPILLDGSLARLQLEKQTSDATETWETETLQLPDITNAAALWFPKRTVDADAADSSENTAVPLAVLLVPPKDRDPAKILESWKEIARQRSVAVCVICSESDEQWRPTEIDAISKLTAASLKRFDSNASSVALIGGGAFTMSEEDNPADSMALAASLSTENVFAGVAISNQTQPPAVRLRKDGPPRLLRVLIPLPPEAEVPFWAETLRRIGCPLQTSPTLNRELCLQWTRSLLAM